MADKLSPEDLAVWWQAYRRALGVLTYNAEMFALGSDLLAREVAKHADEALAQYKARQHHTEGREP